MKVLMPVAITVVADDIWKKMKDLRTDSDQKTPCTWLFCTFKCGNTTISEQQYNYMANKFNSKLGNNCDNKSCDQCR